VFSKIDREDEDDEGEDAGNKKLVSFEVNYFFLTYVRKTKVLVPNFPKHMDKNQVEAPFLVVCLFDFNKLQNG